MLPFEHGAENRGILVALIKRCQEHRTKPLAVKECIGFDAIVVYANLFVGVSDSDVEGEIVVEGGGVVDEVELGERGVGDIEVNPVGAKDEPEDEDGKAYNNNDCADEL